MEKRLVVDGQSACCALRTLSSLDGVSGWKERKRQKDVLLKNRRGMQSLYLKLHVRQGVSRGGRLVPG